MSTDYELWYLWQRKVIREEMKDESHQYNITVNSENEQENECTEGIKEWQK